MNPNFYGQPNKEEQKNQFLNPSFGSQQNTNPNQPQQSPFGSQQPGVFGNQQPGAFGGTQPTGSSIFGGQSNTQPLDPFKSQPTPTMFGNQQHSQQNQQPSGFQSQSPFGSQTQPSMFSTPSAPIQSPFGTTMNQNQSMTPSAQGGFVQSQPTQTLTIQPSTPLVNQPLSQGLFTPSTPGRTESLNPQQPMESTPSGVIPTSIPSQKDDTIHEEKSRQQSSLFPGEKNISFIQMTLGEIIQQQTRRLEENIKVFKEKAKEVFDQDERIIRSLNNYRLIRNKIDEEERIIAEAEENVDFFEAWLCDFQKDVPEGNGDELLTCIKELERVSDRYNKAIETLKDEEDEVMCLVNENYNLISIIDEKLDVLERY